jgi:hypothetical protein
MNKNKKCMQTSVLFFYSAYRALRFISGKFDHIIFIYFGTKVRKKIGLIVDSLFGSYNK